MAGDGAPDIHTHSAFIHVAFTRGPAPFAILTTDEFLRQVSLSAPHGLDHGRSEVPGAAQGSPQTFARGGPGDRVRHRPEPSPLPPNSSQGGGFITGLPASAPSGQSARGRAPPCCTRDGGR